MTRDEINTINETLNIDDLFGFVDVTVKVDSKYKISPLIAHVNGRLTDVNGIIRIVIFTEELKFVLEFGGVISKIHGGIMYERGKPLKDFVDDLYQMRLDTDNVSLKETTKLILNSGYGRFGLKMVETVTKVVEPEVFDRLDQIIDVEMTQNIADKAVIFNRYHYTFMESYDFTDPKYEGLESYLKPSFNYTERAIQIASAVAAYGRINLLRTVFHLYDKGALVAYMDTDSIYFSRFDIKGSPIISDNELGKWKIEQTDISAIFIQPKFFITRNKDGKLNVKLKGLPANALSSSFNNDVDSNSSIWNMFYKRYLGNTIEVLYNKAFIRDKVNAVVRTKNDIRHVLAPEINSKRIKIMDSNDI